MAEVFMSTRPQYTETMTTIPMATQAPQIDMVSNPQFVFPMRSQPSSSTEPSAFSTSAPISHRRPMSFHTSNASSRPRTAESRHMRGVSALPSFSFSATDKSGLQGEQNDQSGHNEALLATPRGGHRRNVSELVGGVGVRGAISASPTKSIAIPITPKGGHRHRRSTAISGHDLSFLKSSAEPQPRLSSSLPSTPLEHPGHVSQTLAADTDPVPLPESPTRPPSRPRVEFSENVEYIPRPLSTISSETGSSMSTRRGHSVNNSISSVLSMSTPSPPSTRTHTRMASLGSTPEDALLQSHRSSLEYRRRGSKEGHSLKGESPDRLPRRPASHSGVEPPKLAFATDDLQSKPQSSHKKRQSIGHALGFDRRRSEPVMGMYSGEPSRLSALSLQEPTRDVRCDQDQEQEDAEFDDPRRSSTRKIKDWAVSKISRITSKPLSEGKDSPATKASSTTTSPSMADVLPVMSEPIAETDLDAVFSQGTEISQPAFTQVFPVAGLGIPSLSQRRSFPSPDTEDYGSMLDLDAALGPFNAPYSQKQRRGLHSSRGTRDFVGQGGAYAPSHGRTYSAPVLSAFDSSSRSSPPQAAMADVFEEEEEEDFALPQAVPQEPVHDEDASLGVHFVDSADVGHAGNGTNFSIDDDRQLGPAWEPEHSTSYSTLNSRLSAPFMGHRPQSIIEDTIMEESSPVEPAIVESHEEPRAPSLTKSSDSSEAPTIMASSTGMLDLPDGQQSLTTPETYQSSEFSSPDMCRRQSSFDTSRHGTSASSITDNRTMSSYTTGEHPHDLRASTDDVPSLTSSRSTMLSTMYANNSRRDISGARTPSVISSTLDPVAATAHRRKRNSIQSLSQLMGGPFGSSRGNFLDDLRPKTAIDTAAKKPKENRLKKLLFWKSKHREASTSTL